MYKTQYITTAQTFPTVHTRHALGKHSYIAVVCAGVFYDWDQNSSLNLYVWILPLSYNQDSKIRIIVGISADLKD